MRIKYSKSFILKYIHLKYLIKHFFNIKIIILYECQKYFSIASGFFRFLKFLTIVDLRILQQISICKNLNLQ